MLRRYSLLQKAFRNRDLSITKKGHSHSAIKDALAHPDEHQSAGRYLGDAVYGALDGMVTTFAVVSGVTGAQLSPMIILILGFANLFADGFSMAAGNYLSKKSEIDYQREEYRREEWEVDNYPKGEKEEIRQIYQAKGFEGRDLERAVEIITSDKERWIKTMMVEELGLISENTSPMTSALVTFFSFLFWGFLPLLTFVLLYFYPSLEKNAFFISCLVTGIAIFTAGSLRSFSIAKSWWKAGFEMLLIGGAAASVAYGIGFFLQKLIAL